MDANLRKSSTSSVNIKIRRNAEASRFAGRVSDKYHIVAVERGRRSRRGLQAKRAGATPSLVIILLILRTVPDPFLLRISTVYTRLIPRPTQYFIPIRMRC